ncbi:tetratricopeptide repeat protein [Amaricoccus solimangrovi]|uniref:Sel1 repeat family protein n=1 Tax=Amaricoccus solimangrovi TaxID=2589815 RepID=A0A501WK32_9RHOB|nr:sel1 repeat family protein [Amaricoccus solimangrovi]TPE49132.1 sel1 repeat family protein [Amaricoccus solimangrovi]
MGGRFLTLLVSGLLALAGPAGAQGANFAAPKPPGKTSAPAPAPIQPRAPAPQAAPAATQPRAAAPASACARVTEGWIDYRPLNDSPVAQGRASSGELFVAADACRSEQAAAPGDRRIAFALARTFEVTGKGAQATPLFRQLADGGYPPATTQLARAYRVGSGVIRDQTRSCDLYVKAAKAGDPWAFNPAADCLSFLDYGHDPKQACRYFQKSLASGTFQTINLSRQDYCQ